MAEVSVGPSETEGPVPATPTLNIGSLRLRAEAVTAAANKLKERRDRANDVVGLSTRLQELETSAGRVRAIQGAAQVLRDEPGLKERLQSQIPASALARLRKESASLHRRLEKDATAILKPKALEEIRNEDIDRIHSAVLASWRQVLAGGTQPGAESVLGQYPKFGQMVSRISAIRGELRGLSQGLPRTIADLERAKQLLSNLQTELNALKDGGLDSAVVDFLRQSVEGVSLADLLSKPQVVAWLQEGGIADRFVVRSGAAVRRNV